MSGGAWAGVVWIGLLIVCSLLPKRKRTIESQVWEQPAPYPECFEEDEEL